MTFTIHMITRQTRAEAVCVICVWQCVWLLWRRRLLPHLTCLLRDWRLHLCGPVSCQLEQLQTCTAQPRSDTQYAAKNGQREADRRPPGSWSTQLSTMEGRNREAALNWANVTFCWALRGRKRLRGNFWVETFHISARLHGATCQGCD